MQEEEDQFTQIIRSSRKNLVTLQLLSNFFNDADLLSIFIRTQIIHNLFENNRSLDPNKLDLFHVQYTSTLIELLQRLKKQKEQQYLLLSDEIYLNEDFISKLENKVGDDSFKTQARDHAAWMSKKITQLYTIFSGESEAHFSWNEVLDFSKTVHTEYYRETDSAVFGKLIPTGKKCYINEYATFEKKLLGRLNILKFRVKFVCGLISDNRIAEIFEFRDSNDKFIFFQDDLSFYFLEDAENSRVDLSPNKSSKEKIIRELYTKTQRLKSQSATIRNEIQDSVKDVIQKYLLKVSSVNFLDELQNVDEQTNILKAMLNININSNNGN